MYKQGIALSFLIAAAFAVKCPSSGIYRTKSSSGCRDYVQCNYGKMTVEVCSTFLKAFDPVKLECDWCWRVNCSAPATPWPAPPTVPPTQPPTTVPATNPPTQPPATVPATNPPTVPPTQPPATVPATNPPTVPPTQPPATVPATNPPTQPPATVPATNPPPPATNPPSSAPKSPSLAPKSSSPLSKVPAKTSKDEPQGITPANNGEIKAKASVKFTTAIPATTPKPEGTWNKIKHFFGHIF